MGEAVWSTESLESADGVAPRMRLSRFVRRSTVIATITALLVTALGPVAPTEVGGPVKVHATESTRAVNGVQDFTVPDGTTHIAIHWTGHPAASVFAALSTDGTTFAAPAEVEQDEVGGARGDGETYGAIITAPHVRAVRVTTDQPLAGVTVVALDAGAQAGIPAQLGTRAAAVNSIPVVIPRAAWGADETIRFDPYGEERWLSQYFPLQKLIVHHTAGSNVDPNPAATVRAIYYYHAVTQDWGDIGYQYLIDSSGRIYEGRHSREYWDGTNPTADDASGLVIAGGHALYHNAGTMGIALMGNFTSVAPTAAAQNSLVSLLTWASATHGVNPTGNSTYVNPVSGVTRTTPNIGGHRDYNSTGCPGGVLYGLLPSIRARVVAATNAWPGQAFNPWRTLSITAGTHVGYQFNAAGAVTGSKAYTLPSASSAPSSQSATIPGQSGTWYYVTSGVWAGYWIAGSAVSSLTGAPPARAAGSYDPWAPLYLAAGTYTGYRFNTWGNVTASASYAPSAATWVPTTERSTVPNQGGYWYYVTLGALRGYWIPESAATTLGSLPMANFNAPMTHGIGQLTVTFNNPSITYGGAAWAWDFDGDGTTDSTERTPTHTYDAVGTYSVGLTVTDSLGTDTMTRADYITVTAPQPSTYVPLTPSRVLDSRSGNGLSGPFTAGVPRTFQVGGVGGVPATATAVTGNLTVTGQSAAGWAYLGPDPVASPTSSTLNFPVGDTRANGVTVALGAGGTLSATLGSASSAHLVFDVTGYFVPDASGATYVPLTPSRVLDSRSGNGLSGPFTAGVPRTFQVGGVGGVPATATAVTGNLTVTGQSAAGWAYLGPDPVASPTSSTLNFPVGDTRANGVTVALGAGGTLSATLGSASSAHLVFDVTGYFVPDASGATYVPLTPSRVLDSRSGNGLSGPFTAGVPRTFQVGGVGGVPATATAVTGNLTVTGQSAAGWAYLGPDPVASPTSSTLNFPVGDTRANGVTVALGAGGTLSATLGSASSAHLVFDVTGYFVVLGP